MGGYLQQPFMDSNDHAVLRIKTLTKQKQLDIPFEDLINQEKSFVRIDFPDGHSFMESEYKKTQGHEAKYFVEFFDSYSRKDLLDYFLRDESDYRVTSVDGTVIRLAHCDFSKRSTDLAEKKENTSFLGNELHAFYEDIQNIKKVLFKIIKKER